MAALAGCPAARGAEADTLGDIVASFDAERKTPRRSLDQRRAGRRRPRQLAQRGLRIAARGETVGPATRYQAASMSKTIAAVTALKPAIGMGVAR